MPERTEALPETTDPPGRISPSRPSVCVVIAALNAEATIAKAVRSALAQPPVAELIVVDDGSRDTTAAEAQSQDDGSGRLKIITPPGNIGPAAARNLALAEAASPYFCVLDADDYMMPGRLARLLAAGHDDWDLIADDIVILPQHAPDAFSLRRSGEGGAVNLNLEGFVRGNISRAGRPRGELGFLKPIVSRAFMHRHALAYDETLRLGEDYALYAQALLHGARFRLVSACGYVAIERHDSLSSRHSMDDLRRIAAFDERMLASHPTLTAGERRALAAHRAATWKKCIYRLALDRKRDNGLAAGLAVLAAHPGALPYVLGETARAKSRAMHRRLRPGVAPAALRPRFLVGFADTQFAEIGRETGERAKPVAGGTRISSEGF